MKDDDASSDGGASSVASSVQSDRPVETGEEWQEEEEQDDLETQTRGLWDVVFYTIYTLNSTQALSRSWRWAGFKIAVEFLQLYKIVLSVAFRILSEAAYIVPAMAIKNHWSMGLLNILQFRVLAVHKGYTSYIIGLYVITGMVCANISYAITIASMLKRSKTNNYFTRWLSWVQLFAKVIYTVLYPALLDYLVSPFNCSWRNLSSGADAYHLDFPDKNCLATPHTAHMLIGGVASVLFSAFSLLMALGSCDLNPMTRTLLASSNAAATFKVLLDKICLVIVSSALSGLGKPQVVFMLVFALFAVHNQCWQVPYYLPSINMVWTGLLSGILAMTCLTLTLEFTLASHVQEPAYAPNIVLALLYCTLPLLVLGVLFTWVRLLRPRNITARVQQAYHDLVEDATTVCDSTEPQTSTVALAGLTVAELRAVHKFKEVGQVSLVCRDMRKWDEDGIADPAAVDFGEFVFKCGMARLHNNPTLLVLYAHYLIEVRKDVHGGTTTLQQAQKAKPSILDRYHIYVAQQLTKGLRGEDGALDLLGYVEYQRSYRACVCAHKCALLAQRRFWQCLLHETTQVSQLELAIKALQRTEGKATDTYRRVLERYPGNGKLLKIYARYLEYVRNDPKTANKFYAEAVKLGTSDSLLSITRGQNIAVLGAINEKVDGLIIINDQGTILMVNDAAITMFGFEEGELEGKNVSVLMPQPISAMHTSYLQRYVDTGVPRLLNKTREMVALNKGRSCFPISLCVTQLKTSGSEVLFMAVVRKPQPCESNGRNTVRFWTTGSGVILGADHNTADSFGLNAADLVGQSVGDLCTDVEKVNRFLCECNSSSTAGTKMHIQMLHAFLPPVNVELSIHFGGAVDAVTDCRILIIQATVLSDDAAVMALDRRGRITFATDRLAAMLGYPVSALVKMDLSALLPQPYAQLHGAWFKDLSRKPPPGSCRSGGVVHMLAANGAKVPVTLQMSMREHRTQDMEDSAGMMHVVQVTKATEADQLDQKRLLLNINHKGTILEVNAGVPKSLFGFTSPELIGRPLAAIIDVFGLWMLKYGDDNSLMTLLGLQAINDFEAAGVVNTQAAAAEEAAGCSWRVAVHPPLNNDAEILEHAKHVAASSGLVDTEVADNSSNSLTADFAGDFLQAIQQKRQLHPACLSIRVLPTKDVIHLADPVAAEVTPVFQVSLYRSDALATVIELDRNLIITHADNTAGLIFGLDARQLHKKSLAGLLALPASTSFEDLLGTKAAAKSAMKSTAGSTTLQTATHAGMASIGVAKRLKVHHLKDGQPLDLELQAISCEQKGRSRRLVRLQVLNPSSASMPALLAMKEGKPYVETTFAANGALEAVPGDTGIAAHHTEQAAAEASFRHSSEGSDKEDCDSRRASDATAEGNGPEARRRTSDWVREASHLQGPEEYEFDPKRAKRVPPLKSSYPQRQAAAAATAGGHVHDYLTPRNVDLSVATPRYPEKGQADSSYIEGASARQQPSGRQHALFGSAGNTPRFPRRSSNAWDEPEMDGPDSGDCRYGATDYCIIERGIPKGQKGPQAPPKPAAGQRVAGVAASDAGSASVGGSDRTSEAADDSVDDNAGAGHDEDLAVNARRAKRLKKLNTMLTSNIAQQAFNKWRRHTLVLLALIIAAHVAGFVVLEREVSARERNAQGVANMGRALDRMQSATLRAAFMQKCYNGDFIETWSCNPDRMASYLTKLSVNIELANGYHRELYLGTSQGGHVDHFKDQRLLDYWTFHQLPEVQFYPEIFNATNVLVTTYRPLWEMGNVFLSAAKDVLHTGYSGDPTKMNLSASWQYVYNNGQNSVFFGYAWSLDTYVDYAWSSLMALGGILIALLLVEVVAVQLGCLTYQFYLLQRCNMSHMRLFSIFLALPSATVRLMAQRQLQVDDDARDNDDDDDDLANLPTTAAADEPAEDTAGDTRKSVRMAAELDDDSNAGPGDKTRKSKAGKSAADKGKNGTKAKLTRSSSRNRTQPHEHKHHGLGARLYKLLLGWLDPKFKMNGKKLITNSSVLWKFTVPLFIWMATVAIIFGVSYDQLHGLQGPLASLDVAIHVQYQLGRCRLVANTLAYSDSHALSTEYKQKLKTELQFLQQEYDTLVFGGPMRLMANVTFHPVAPASIYSNAALSRLFFTTKDCLRADKSTCFAPDSPYYAVTHGGIDPMIKKYIEQMNYFASLPDEQALANNSAYEWVLQVIANDGYDAMNTAIETFAQYNVNKLAVVLQLHIALLVISLLCPVFFVLLLYRPYNKLLDHHSKAVAGMLSQLPAEVDVESHVKSIVLGLTGKPGAAGQQSFGGAAVVGPAGELGRMTNGMPWNAAPGGYAQQAGGWAGPNWPMPAWQNAYPADQGYTAGAGGFSSQYQQDRA